MERRALTVAPADPQKCLLREALAASGRRHELTEANPGLGREG